MSNTETPKTKRNNSKALSSSEKGKVTPKVREYGPLVISAYAFVSMMTIFVLHELSRACSLELYTLFSERFPSESQTWGWTSGCDMNPLKAWITGIIAGIVVFVAVYHMTTYGLRETDFEVYDEEDYALKRRKNIIIGGVTIGVFLGIFAIASLLSDVHLVYRTPDMLFALVLAGIIGISITLYNGNKMRRTRRRDFYDDKVLQLEEFRFDHDSAKEVFHLSVFVFVTLFASIFFVLVFRFFQQLPPEILYSDPFITMTSKNAGYAIIITIGFFVGVLLQELQNLVDIRHVIRIYHKKIAKSSQTQ